MRVPFDQGMPDAEPPSPICWAGIYHPGMEKNFMTDLTSYEKTFLREGRPTVGLLFIGMSGSGMTCITRRHS